VHLSGLIVLRWGAPELRDGVESSESCPCKQPLHRQNGDAQGSPAASAAGDDSTHDLLGGGGAWNEEVPRGDRSLS